LNEYSVWTCWIEMLKWMCISHFVRNNNTLLEYRQHCSVVIIISKGTTIRGLNKHNIRIQCDSCCVCASSICWIRYAKHVTDILTSWYRLTGHIHCILKSSYWSAVNKCLQTKSTAIYQFSKLSMRRINSDIQVVLYIIWAICQTL